MASAFRPGPVIAVHDEASDDETTDETGTVTSGAQRSGTGELDQQPRLAAGPERWPDSARRLMNCRRWPRRLQVGRCAGGLGAHCDAPDNVSFVRRVDRRLVTVPRPYGTFIRVLSFVLTRSDEEVLEHQSCRPPAGAESS